MLKLAMLDPAYTVARIVAPRVADHLVRHRALVMGANGTSFPSLLPDAKAIEALIDAAFWASLRREEGYEPKISLAYLPPTDEVRPLTFATPLPLDPGALTKMAPAVERPGIHLGVWRNGDGDTLSVWGATRNIPPFCFVVEVVAPGLLVLKHRPRYESRKFVNVAVLEGDRIKIVDERASMIPDCPAVLTSLLSFDTPDADTVNVLVQIAVSMRKHLRGGALLVVPSGSSAWQESIMQPIAYRVEPPHRELSDLVYSGRSTTDHDWQEALTQSVDVLAGLTAVDGATIITDRYELLAFGAKIRRKTGGTPVEQLVTTEPTESGQRELVHPGQLGGTRHLSAGQFILDQPDALALVASQDGRFTIFVWSPCDGMVHAHRVEMLLM